MRVSCIQLDMALGAVDENYEKAERLIRQTVRQQHSDVVVLPETWSTGYFPRENIQKYCEHDCDRSRAAFSALSSELGVNIVAGSVMNLRDGKVFNTAQAFDREGRRVAQYDKTHLFTPMDEHKYFSFGDSVCVFELDGEKCGIAICYDLRFTEFIRTMALDGIHMLFVVSQWPDKRTAHLDALVKARAIENQMFVVCCNSCGKADGSVFGGHSSITDPWGETLAHAGAEEQIITADCDFSIIKDIRSSINVFNDRRPELYRLR